MRIGRTLPPAASPIYPRDILSGIKGLLRGQRELGRFESELTEHFGVKHCFLISSGKAALTLILQALTDMHPDRDEVLIPAFTCYSVPSAIVRAGLKVKLCDINPETLDFDFDQLKRILSQSPVAKKPDHFNRHNEPNKPSRPNNLSARSYELRSSNPQPATRNSMNPTNPINSANPKNRLLAIVPVHLFGLPADIQRLREMIDDPQIVIIEDAAQTFGAEWKDRKLGTLGDVGFFSLGRGKALSTVEGGIILTDREEIAGRIELQLARLPNYNVADLFNLIFEAISITLFLRPLLFWFPKSLPFLKLGDTIYDPNFKIRKMSGFQAGLANGWQEKVKRFKKIRKENAKQWASLLEKSYIDQHFFGRIATQQTQETQQTQITQATQLPDLIRFPLRIYDEALRAEVLRRSDRMGLGIMFTYPDSIDGIREIKANFKSQTFPMAKELANDLITLPIHPFVSQKDKAQIAAVISQITPYEI